MLSKSTCVCFSIIFSITIFCATAATQEADPAAKNKTLDVTVEGFSEFLSVAKILGVGEGAIVVFAQDSIEDTTFHLRGFKFSENGTAGEAKQIVSDASLIYGVDAVWNSTDNSPPLPATQNGEGLGFVAYSPDNSLTKAVFCLFRFNSDGHLVGQPEIIKEINAPKNHTIDWAWTAAGAGEKTTGLSFSASFRNTKSFDITSSGGYFAEFDSEGKLKKKLSPIKSKKAGRLTVFRPCQLDGRWMVCAANTVVSDWQVKECRLLAGAAKRKVRLKNIATDKQTIPNRTWDKVGMEPTYSSAQFLSTTATSAVSAGAGATIKLFVEHRNYLPETSTMVKRYDCDYSIYEINQKGKKVGKPAMLDVDPWQPEVENDGSHSLAVFWDVVSDALPLENGNYLFFINRTLALNGTSAPDYWFSYEGRSWRIEVAPSEAQIFSMALHAKYEQEINDPYDERARRFTAFIRRLIAIGLLDWQRDRLTADCTLRFFLDNMKKYSAPVF